VFKTRDLQPERGEKNMFKRWAYIIVIGSLLSLQGCGMLIFSEEKRAMKKHQIHEDQYNPYKLQNTIEGYREFIAKYPKNLFVNEAKIQIENLEFAPYEREDNIEGYMEFKIRYPDNRHIFKASVKIEQVEFKRYEKIDTIEAYKEFLSKYPDSTLAILAKERLQELEFRDLDKTFRKKYGVDLLLYRLNLKRLKKKLGTIDGVNLGDFICFVSIANNEGKKYFHTHLIYYTDLSYLDSTSKEVTERFFDPLVSKALVYLDSHFMNKDEIDGFSFDISSSAHLFYGDRKIVCEYYFPISEVNLFAQNKLDKKDLLAQSIITSPKKVVSEAKPGTVEEKPHLEKATTPPVKMDGFSIMTMVNERGRGEDYIISRSWEKGRHSMTSIEKRKNFYGKDGFINKSIIRYIDPPGHYGTAILIWNYKDREKAFWYRLLHTGSARIANTERLRPPAEFDFNLTDYVDINVGEERHELLRSEGYEGKICYVVESIPVKKDIRYGKRTSWIDQRYFIPLKTEYFDKRGNPWKILHIEWQNKFGFWFWKKAVAENVQTGNKTFITIEDVRINLRLHDRDFTKSGLEQKKHGF
jgi:hypothetical protein